MRLSHSESSRTLPYTTASRLSRFLLLAMCLILNFLAYSQNSTHKPASALGQNTTQNESPAYAHAEALIRSHQWNAGLALVQQLLKQNPRNLRLLNLAGLAQTGVGDLAAADAYFQQAIALNPAFAPAIKNLAINEFQLKHYPAAEKHLLTAHKLLPQDPILPFFLGEIYYLRQEYHPAMESFQQAGSLLASNPTASAHLAISSLLSEHPSSALAIVSTLDPAQLDAPTQAALGLALAQNDAPERAIPFLSAAHSRLPNIYDLGYDLMLCQIAAHQNESAIAIGKELIARGQETSELNNILAEAYVGHDEIQPAVDALRRAISLDPSDEDNYLDFASLCMNQRSIQAGMTVIDVAIEALPHSDRLIFMRGLLHAMQDEFELAEKDFRLSTSLSPQKNLGYIGLGVSYLETGHDAQAIEILRQRLRDKPEDASLLYLLGEALLRSGATPGSSTYQEAQTSLEKSVHLNPNLCLPHISLGTIYLDESRAQDAVAQFESARSIDPKERSAYSHLATAYRNAGQPEKARAVLSSLRDLIAQERQNTRDRMKEQSERIAPVSPASKDQ